MVNALTYHNTQFITTVKSCLVQGQVAEAPANVVGRQMSFENVPKNVFSAKINIVSEEMKKAIQFGHSVQRILKGEVSLYC